MARLPHTLAEQEFFDKFRVLVSAFRLAFHITSEFIWIIRQAPAAPPATVPITAPLGEALLPIAILKIDLMGPSRVR